jgi:pseudouridine-5'-monophosphatase
MFRLPPIRACLFDLDGLLINSEDLLTEARNSVLYEYYSHSPMDWTVKAQLQGRSATESTRILYEWAGLPLTGITIEEFQGKLNARLHEMFKKTGLMPGAGELLRRSSRATTAGGGGGGQGTGRVEMALATSSQTAMYKLKTARLEGEGEGGVLRLIPEKHKILGDDARLKEGRGKPAPDIFLHALEAVNEGLREKGDMEREIKPVECLVFEDAVAGVEAARRAGMRVVWVPDPGLRELYRGQEGEVLAGMTGERRRKDDGQVGEVGEVGEGWGELLSSLEDFEYEKYGIVVEDR